MSRGTSIFDFLCIFIINILPKQKAQVAEGEKMTHSFNRIKEFCTANNISVNHALDLMQVRNDDLQAIFDAINVLPNAEEKFQNLMHFYNGNGGEKLLTKDIAEQIKVALSTTILLLAMDLSTISNNVEDYALFLNRGFAVQAILGNSPSHTLETAMIDAMNKVLGM